MKFNIFESFPNKSSEQLQKNITESDEHSKTTQEISQPQKATLKDKVRKYGKTTIVSLGLSLASMHGDAQTIDEEGNEHWLPKPTTTEGFIKMANNSPTVFFHYFDSTDKSTAMEALIKAKKNILDKEPGLLIKMLNEHKDDPEIFDSTLLHQAFLAAINGDPRNYNPYAVVENQKLLESFPDGKDILDKALSEYDPFLLMAGYENEQIEQSPFNKDLLVKHIERAARDLLRQGKADELSLRSNILFWESWGTDILRELAHSDPKKTAEIFNYQRAPDYNKQPTEKEYQPIAQECVDWLFKNDPTYICEKSGVLHFAATDSNEYEQMLEHAAREAVSGGNSSSVSHDYFKISRKPYGPEVLRQSVLNDPTGMYRVGDTRFEKDTNIYMQKCIELNRSLGKMDELDPTSHFPIFGALQYITDNSISVEEAKKMLKEPSRLMKAYLYTLQSPNPVGQEATRIYMLPIALKSVHALNELHNENDEVRFASVKDFSAGELYALSTYGEQEAFTSTFNGLFNRIRDQITTSGESGYVFLEKLKFDHARNFIKECSEYNRLNDFLSTMSHKEQEQLLSWFIENINTEKDVIEQGVCIADVISSVEDASILKTFGSSIEKQYNEAIKNKNVSLQTAYGLLGSIYSKKAHVEDSVFARMTKQYPLESFSELRTKDLKGSDGKITERYFFYNDPEGKVNDGQASYASFIHEYKNDTHWTVREKASYTVITSKQGQPIIIYANKPSEAEQGNKTIDSALNEGHIPTNMVVHRGHSYHAESTIEKIPDSTKFVSLGSCGGFHNLNGVLRHAPNAQVFSTKGIGTMKVNDPVFKAINEELRHGNDIHWHEFWNKFEETLGKNDPRLKNYIPPNKNLGFMYIRAYNTLMSQQNSVEGK